jgi:hypothetical protein
MWYHFVLLRKAVARLSYIISKFWNIAGSILAGSKLPTVTEKDTCENLMQLSAQYMVLEQDGDEPFFHQLYQ